VELDLIKFTGMPLNNAVQQLEKLGLNVKVFKYSKPKIKTDYELVVKARMLSETEVELIVGDFLINIEDRDELV